MLKMPDAEEVKDMRQKELKHTLKRACCKSIHEEKEAEFPEAEQLREMERVVLLKAIDTRWMDHR